jgi:hypothetical protein
MLTPAEELGLSGLNLASRVRKAFYNITETRLVELLRSLRDEAFKRHLIYLRDGELETVQVFACPMTALPEQVTYVHFVTQTIQNALKRLPEVYMADNSAREMLRLPADEERWLLDCWGPRHRESNPIFGRLDAMIDFLSPTWKDTLKFVEPNLSGIGGLHLVPTAEHILFDLVVPVLQELDPALSLQLGHDIRELLMQEALDHLEALKRPASHICFVEPKYAGSGPDEQEELARYFHDRYQLKVTHADPAELTLAGGQVCYEGAPIDLAYRDYAVADLLVLEKEGKDVQPMRTLFQQNRIISSIAAELDQKSCWEVLTDPVLTHRFFTPDECQVFRRHILWTRIVSDRQTLLPDGRSGPLLEYIRGNRESLVLKPNRAYGGSGVVIGPMIEQAAWESALDSALADRERWVVQQLASLTVSEFPVLGPDGKPHIEPFYTVMGFAPSKYGLAILARASQKQVVNVAQRGGIAGVLIGRPPGKLHGPAIK